MKWLRRLRKHSSLVAPILMLVIGTLLHLQNPQFLRTFQLKLFDQYQQIKPRTYEPAPVAIIDIDEESLKRLGQWPWPRTKLAQMLARVFENGARVVAFDIVFAEPDRTAPQQVLPAWLDVPTLDLDKLPEEWRNFATAILQSVPDNDQVFAETIAQISNVAPHYGVVVGFAFNDVRDSRMPEVKAGYVMNYGSGENPDQFITRFPGAAPNLKPFEDAAAGIGTFNLVPDPDNIVRRVPLVTRGLKDDRYPALSMEALRVYLGATTYQLKAAGSNKEENYGTETGLARIRIGGGGGDRIEIPVDGSGSFWVHYTASVPERYIPAWTIFEPDFDASLVEGKILYVGTSAAGLRDLRTTPLQADTPGVEVHAQATEQILLQHFLTRTDWAEGGERAFMVVLGIALIVVTTRWGAAIGAAIGLAFVTTAAAASWYAYDEHRLLFDPLYPALICLLVYLASSLLSYLSTEAEKRRVRGAFAQYLSPDLVEQLAQDPERLRLGGETKNMTFLFCDVRGFTSISETFKSNPQGLTVLINKFLTPMTNAIMRRNGTIDKYMGDCIMAFWNAPLDDPDHVQHACESALAMQRELGALNERLKADAEAEGRRFVPLNIGIGLNTGDCVVGNMGSDQRFDYSVLGDAVNLASRLEGQSKTYGVTNVIGEDTAAQAPDYALIELDLIAVKGKAEAVRIYTILGDQAYRDTPEFAKLLDEHVAMIAAYREQNWDSALQHLRRCREMQDGRLDELYNVYEERIEMYVTAPPGPDWDGVFIATSK